MFVILSQKLYNPKDTTKGGTRHENNTLIPAKRIRKLAAVFGHL